LSSDLRPREKTVLSENIWSISAIVLWEIAKLVELGRIELDLDDPQVVHRVPLLTRDRAILQSQLVPFAV